MLFERLGLVLLPPGAGNTPASKHSKGSAHKEPTLEQFIAKTRELLQLEEQHEVEQAEAELENYSAAGAQVSPRCLQCVLCVRSALCFFALLHAPVV